MIIIKKHPFKVLHFQVSFSIASFQSLILQLYKKTGQKYSIIHNAEGWVDFFTRGVLIEKFLSTQ